MKGGWWAHQTKGHGGPSRSGESPTKDTGVITKPATPAPAAGAGAGTAGAGTATAGGAGGKPTNNGKKKSPMKTETAAPGATATPPPTGTAAPKGGSKTTGGGKKKSPVRGAAKEGRKTRGHAAHQRGIEQAQEFASIESTQIADIPNVSYVGSPLSDKEGGVTEQIKSEKHRAYEMSKKHAGKPGFQAYLDKVFGGPTKVEGSVTHTEKRIK